MGYPYEDLAGDEQAGKEAKDFSTNAGACPPELIRYRIYPETDFNAIFGTPPANVTT